MLNGSIEEFPESEKMTIQELLDKKKFTFKQLVISINKKFIPKTEYQIAEIQNNDEVVVLHLMSGG